MGKAARLLATSLWRYFARGCERRIVSSWGFDLSLTLAASGLTFRLVRNPYEPFGEHGVHAPCVHLITDRREFRMRPWSDSGGALVWRADALARWLRRGAG